MKNFYKIFATLLFLCVSSMIVSAQTLPTQDTNPPTATTTLTEQKVSVVNDTETQVTNKYFDLVLIKKSQSVFTGYVRYELKITPHISSTKTQILWEVPTTLKAIPRHKEFINMQEGVTYTVKADIKPLREGEYDVTASIISWQHDTNYTNAVSGTLKLNKSLLLEPISTEYIVGSILKYLLIIASAVIIILLVLRHSNFYAQKARKWLTPPY